MLKELVGKLRIQVRREGLGTKGVAGVLLYEGVRHPFRCRGRCFSSVGQQGPCPLTACNSEKLTLGPSLTWTHLGKKKKFTYFTFSF